MRFSTNRITRKKGFTRKELIVVIAVIGVISILLSIFCSKLAKAYTRAGRIKCSNNLKEISLAFRMYAGDNNGKFPMASESAEVELSNKLQVWQYFQSVSNHLGSPKLLLCPRDKKYLLLIFQVPKMAWHTPQDRTVPSAISSVFTLANQWLTRFLLATAR